MRLRWKPILGILCSLLLTLSLAIPPALVEAKRSSAPLRQVAVGKEGMVVTAHPLATQVGADVLRQGGNAVDAAVAIQFALNVVEPMMSGIGGGGFMMVYDAKTRKVSIVNSRERAPMGAKPDMFLDEDGNPIPFPERHTHGNAVGVPGTLKGLETALEKWGTRPLSKLIDPAIRLAERGVKVNWVLADAIEENKEKLARTAARDVFLPGGKPLKEGDLLVQKDLAKTLRLIQKHGTDVFYRGKVGEAIARTVREHGGSMTLDDLKRYRVTLDRPVRGTFRDYEIVSMPPPSSGGLTAIQILKMLEELEAGRYDVRSPEKYHLLAEAMHLAYADRGAYIGDPEFVDVPMKGLLHPEYIRERSALVSMDRANPEVKPGDPWKYEGKRGKKPASVQPDDRPIGQTTHFTVADRWGNLVSYTTTIEQLFGSGIMVPEYGILLNNELTDFDAVPGGPNEVRPFKRPMSSMTPTIVFRDGKPVLTVGSPGGATIIASVFQVILHKLEYGMPLKAAIEEPRIYSNRYPDIRWEEGVPEEARSRLQELGHRWESAPVNIGNVQSIWIDHRSGLYIGAADSTREGAAVGLFGKGKKK
ncbi:gamma-glutamyltransferase 1 . Threonine peptidase. MEROPS family T03 [Planifilum fulgidum]|uniref:Glutathione hydrolase proenzyme n=1 Tax=Planifilum fulgidum TaxID=201973 RepID=A0A1I2P9Q3_9BACL|nr:gamma-glutamyltransferase [Planifilum fulgidum]SFG12233.1 gamma-glutamyltransferase 1 . Threonine peptidase. MEROPS family T03 [Planifilum fulgidum]